MEVRTQQSGRLEDVSPLDLLQSLHIYRRAGHVVLVHPHGRSQLWFEAGEIVDAESGALRGAAALYRIATHERGEFRVEVTGEARARTIERSGSAMIFEAAYRIDEGKRLRGELPATEAVLLRPPTAIPIHGPTEEHRRVVAMLEVGATLGEVLERSALGELETLQWMAELVKAGQLGPTGAVRSPEPPAGAELAGSSLWPLGLEPSQPFVPSPSYASHEERDDSEPTRRRWWIAVSLGASLAAVVTLVLVRGGADAPTQAAVVSAPVTAIDAARAVVPAAEPAPREPTVAVGASASEQTAVAGDRGGVPAASPRPTLTSKGRSARGRDRSAGASTEAAPSAPVLPEPRPAAADGLEDASALLNEARRAYAAGQGATAYRLAARSQKLRPSGDASELMTLAACQEQRPDAAADALRGVPLRRRSHVRSACRQAHGVRLKLGRSGR